MRSMMAMVGVLAAVSLGATGAAQAKTITVAADGSGDFKTLQDAIAAAPSNAREETVIHIKPGAYAGPFLVDKQKPHLTLLGDDAATTVLTWDRNVQDPKPPGGDGFNPGLLVRADDFHAARLTIQNTSGDHGQALAVRADGDRALFVNCRILGWQDTLMVNNGRDYFQDCYIAGRVDFIYGSAAAWFENCEIHSRNGGHVTAASTPQDHPFGFVFDHCKLTGDSDAWDPATTNPATTQKARATPIADLGRPWRPYASVTYLNCDMGAHISPAGWNNWGKTSNEQTARYAEYHSTGPGGSAEKRAAWTHQLTDEQAKAITAAAVLGGKDAWDPQAAAKAPAAEK
ncbi:MAG TPA: pectinesterase family protein [Phycisphaerae bacterium]|nr:pectinesterase family protein [Phycisphaerae bacterium]